MSYPQSSVVEAIRQGQEYWRLFTPLVSSGDIYEAEVSSRALVIGSDSDIARANVIYYDIQNPNIANCASVSVDKPFLGRMDAIASQTYQSKDRARLLISTLDLMPPLGFRPPSAGDDDPLSIVQPYIDLLFYLGEQPGFIPPRSNKIHLLEQLPAFASTDPQWMLVPFYGRRFAEVTIKSLGLAVQPAFDAKIYGINFSNVIADPALADNGHQQELLGTMSFGVPVLGAGITDSLSITNRAFDYLAIEIDSSGSAFPDAVSVITHIVTSDKI